MTETEMRPSCIMGQRSKLVTGQDLSLGYDGFIPLDTSRSLCFAADTLDVPLYSIVGKPAGPAGGTDHENV